MLDGSIRSGVNSGIAGWFDKERREFWYWRKVYEWRCHTALRMARGLNVLDYGAGAGWFVKVANSGVFAAIGYEP
jgi:hypothetical protein